ncbi:DUF805 domain-containing protein [Paenibacillus campi]|uniref:DUF805 domain-containing protein n=1 Tax=Paenibacillus campi TaxID=3106031 RepID=UPI002AFED869|nr:DUF805 domain-containing protein [Paenibacillus sp. SGZ-1009]
MNWYVKVLRNYVNFKGRARRMEYWMYVLISIPITLALYLLDYMLSLNNLLTGLYSLAVLLPGLSVTIRRLHDTNRSGGWIWFFFVPVVGPITLFVFMCLEGTRGDNRFGSSPKPFV